MNIIIKIHNLDFDDPDDIISTLKHLFHDCGVANTISTYYKYNI